MQEEFEGTIDYLLSEAEALRPTTNGATLTDRQAEVVAIIAQGQARAQTALTQINNAILRLPLPWPQAQFAAHYPPHARRQGAVNPPRRSAIWRLPKLKRSTSSCATIELQ